MAKPLVIQILPALNDGGVERSTLEMAAFLQKNGWPNRVISAGGRLEYELSLLGVPHHKLPLTSKSPLAIFFNALKLAIFLRQTPTGIVHVRSRGPAWSTWLALKLYLKPSERPKFVSTFHGTYGAGSFLKRCYNRVMLKGTVIANSAFIARHIAATYDYPLDKIEIAPRGVDFSRLETTANESVATAWGEPEKGTKKPWKLLCVGRLTRWKGQDALLEALAEVQRQAPQIPWKLALVGSAVHKDLYVRQLRKFIQNNDLKEKILLLGSRDDVLALNEAADLAFSPSLRPEAFGRAAIEAMAMGTPVIATKLGGSIETIVDGKTGFLVDVAAPGEDVLTATHPKIRADVPQALAQTIISALTDPGRLASMGDEARRHVRQRFTSDKTCAAELKAYEKALGMKPAANKKSN